MWEKKFDEMVLQRKPKFQFVISYYNGQQNGFQLIVLAYTVTDTFFNEKIDIANVIVLCQVRYCSHGTSALNNDKGQMEKTKQVL